MFKIFVLFFSLFLIGSCSNKSNIDPLFKKNNFLTKKNKRVLFRYPIVPEDVGTYEFKSVSGINNTRITSFNKFFKTLKFTFQNFGVKYLKMGKLKISSELSLPELDERFVNNLFIKKVYLGILPCKGEVCGSHVNENFDINFLNEIFINISLNKNQTEIGNEFASGNTSMNEEERAQVSVQDEEFDSFDFEIEKVSKKQFAQKSKYADLLMSLNSQNKLPLEISDTNSTDYFYKDLTIARYNAKKNYTKVDKNLLILSNYLNYDILASEINSKFTNSGKIAVQNKSGLKVYTLGERIFIESAQPFQEILDETIKEIKMANPMILSNKYFKGSNSRIVDVTNCEKNPCLQFDILNVNLMPLFKNNDSIKIETYVDINKIPQTDFIYVGFIEFDADVIVDLEL